MHIMEVDGVQDQASIHVHAQDLDAYLVSNPFCEKCWEFRTLEPVSGLTAFAAAHWYDRNHDGKVDHDEVLWEVWGCVGDETTREAQGPWVITIMPGTSYEWIAVLEGPVVNGTCTKVARNISRRPDPVDGFMLPQPWEKAWYDQKGYAASPGSSGSIHGPHAESAAVLSGLQSTYMHSLDYNLDVTFGHRRVHYLDDAGEPAAYHASSGYPNEGININAPDIDPPLLPRLDGSHGDNQITSIDMQHAFRPIRHLAAWKTTGSRAEQRAVYSFLRALAGNRLLDSTHPDHDPNRNEDNQRALGWALKCFIFGYQLTGEQWMLANAVRLIQMVEDQVGEKNGIHYLTLNEAGLHRADHSFCRIHGFQMALLADAVLRGPRSVVSDELRDHAVLTMHDLIAGGGRFYKDTDPTGPDGETGEPRLNMGSYASTSVGAGTEKWYWPAACAAWQWSSSGRETEVAVAGAQLLANMESAWAQTTHMRLGSPYFDGSILAACYPVMKKLPGS